MRRGVAWRRHGRRDLARRRVRVYAADLPLWRELAAGGGGPVLDVGAGTGRVTLDLAGTARGPRARRRPRACSPRCASAPRPRPGGDDARRPTRATSTSATCASPLILVPMQTVQLLEGGTAARLPGLRAPAPRAGRPARCAIADALDAFDEAQIDVPVPDMHEVDGVVYASRPVAVATTATAWHRAHPRDRRRRRRATPRATTIRLDRLDAPTLDAEGRAAASVLRAALHETDEYIGTRWWCCVPRACASARCIPDLMNIYADRGNLLLLERRCAWRASASRSRPPAWARRSTPTPTTSSTSAAARTATSACAPTTSSRPSATRCTPPRRRQLVLGVCGGFQLLGHSYELGDEEIPGVGLVDLRTVRERGPRLIGNVAIEVPGRARPRARRLREPRRAHPLGAGEQPLGRVLQGHGNTGASGFEGVRRATCDRHLPARAAAAQERLVRRLADHRHASGGRRLAPLDDRLEDAAHASARRAAGLRVRLSVQISVSPDVIYHGLRRGLVNRLRAGPDQPETRAADGGEAGLVDRRAGPGP